MRVTLNDLKSDVDKVALDEFFLDIFAINTRFPKSKEGMFWFIKLAFKRAWQDLILYLSDKVRNTAKNPEQDLVIIGHSNVCQCIETRNL